MIRLLIVDDELITRQGIRYSIDWEMLEVEVIGEADSVDSAIELMHHYHPDIVLCDIRMPGRSGLDLIEETRTVFPDTHFILISAYDDRDYMLNAIRNGVDDYLLKPIYAQQLKDTISKVIKSISAQRKSQEKSLASQRLLSNNLDTLRSVYVEDMLSGKLENKTIKEGLSSLSISLNGPRYMLMLSNKNSPLAWETIQRINIQFQVFTPVILSGIKYDLLYLFLNIPEEYILSADTLAEKLHQEFGSFVVASPVCSDLSACCAFFAQMNEVLMRSMWYGDYITVDRTNPACPEFPSEEVINAKNDILEAFRKNDSELEIKRLFESLITLLSDSRCRNAEYASTTDELLQAIRLLLNISKATVTNDHDSGPESLEKTRKDFYKLCDQLKHPRYVYRNTLCGRIISHIESHYAEPISLETVASDLFLSPYYIAHLLKEKTNHSFLDWLHWVRIEKAKEMLYTTDQSIQSISSDIGYNSYKTFCKHFLDFTGLYPVQFRQQSRNSENM